MERIERSSGCSFGAAFEIGEFVRGAGVHGGGAGEGEDGWADKIAKIEDLVTAEVMMEESRAAAPEEKKKKLAAGPPQPVGLKRPLQDPEEKTKKLAAKLEPLSEPGSAIQNFLP